MDLPPPPALGHPPPAPSDFTRRTLRAWALFQAAYALGLGALAVLAVPWKTPGWNLLLLAYAALHLASTPGLWRQRRWGWRLAAAGGLGGLALGVVVVSGLVASWAYLSAVYGGLGQGASLVALLLAGLAGQALGLYPALLLRALLRREVRADLGLGRGWGRAALGLLLLPPLVGAAVWTRHAMPTLEPVPERGRAQACARLRAALEGQAAGPLDALVGVPVGDGLFVTLWEGGRPRARVEGRGQDLAQAVEEAARALARADLSAAARAGRLKVDRVVGAAPVLCEWAPVLALSVDPGRDGLRRGPRTLLPDDLVRAGAFGAAPLLPGSDEVRLGLRAEVLAGLGDPASAPLERLRTEAWIEHAGGVLAVERGNTPGPGRGPAAWRQAALAGGEHLLRQLGPDGRFHYTYDPLADAHPSAGPGDYSLARHAGAAYALSQLHARSGAPAFREGARRAIEWLARRTALRPGPPDWGFLTHGEWASLGAASLAAVAMLEYQRATGDPRYADVARRLVELAVRLQRPDGEFHHLYHPGRDAVDPAARELYASGEAALALVLAHRVLGEARHLEAARRALDHLTGPKYEAFFLGRFVHGDDHWTCMAAAEAAADLRAPGHLAFARSYAGFLRRLQYPPRGWPPGFAGHHGLGTLLLPQPAASAGFTEAVLSTWEATGDPELALQAAASLDALVEHQLRADNAWLAADPEAARGGFRRTLAEHDVRIDFTQHAVSALIRGAVLLEPARR